jgi:hypothetical protein
MVHPPIHLASDGVWEGLLASLLWYAGAEAIPCVNDKHRDTWGCIFTVITIWIDTSGSNRWFYSLYPTVNGPPSASGLTCPPPSVNDGQVQVVLVPNSAR